jgi:hypothetical protein
MPSRRRSPSTNSLDGPSCPPTGSTCRPPAPPRDLAGRRTHQSMTHHPCPRVAQASEERIDVRFAVLLVGMFRAVEGVVGIERSSRFRELWQPSECDLGRRQRSELGRLKRSRVAHDVHGLHLGRLRGTNLDRALQPPSGREHRHSDGGGSGRRCANERARRFQHCRSCGAGRATAADHRVLSRRAVVLTSAYKTATTQCPRPFPVFRKGPLSWTFVGGGGRI